MAHCKRCGIEERADYLFKGLCEECVNILGISVCERCESREATEEIPVNSRYTMQVCKGCLADSCYIVHSLGY